MATKARLRRATAPLVALGAAALAIVASVSGALGYWDLARTWRERAPQAAQVLDFLSSTRGTTLLVILFLVALLWTYHRAVNPGGRAAARRLHDLAKFGIDKIMNEVDLKATPLLMRYRDWNEDVVTAMREEGCAETEIAEFERMGEVTYIVTPGPTDEHRDIQRMANTKVQRLRRAAARLEGLTR